MYTLYDQVWWPKRQSCSQDQGQARANSNLATGWVDSWVNTWMDRWRNGRTDAGVAAAVPGEQSSLAIRPISASCWMTDRRLMREKCGSSKCITHRISGKLCPRHQPLLSALVQFLCILEGIQPRDPSKGLLEPYEAARGCDFHKVRGIS